MVTPTGGEKDVLAPELLNVTESVSEENGHSKVIDAFGKEVLSSTENKEEVLQIGISLNDLKIKRRKLNFLQDGDNFKLL